MDDFYVKLEHLPGRRIGAVDDEGCTVTLNRQHSRVWEHIRDGNTEALIDLACWLLACEASGDTVSTASDLLTQHAFVFEKQLMQALSTP